MKRHPEHSESTRRSATTADSLFIDAPLCRPASNELQRTSCVIQTRFHRRIDLLCRGIRNQPVVDRRDRDSVLKALRKKIRIRLVATHPADAVNEEEKRRRRYGISLVEVEHLP